MVLPVVFPVVCSADEASNLDSFTGCDTLDPRFLGLQ